MFGLITSSKLKHMLASDHGCVVIDARRRYEYNAGHIPEAICMRWEQWCEPAPQGSTQTMQQPGWWGKLADFYDANFGHRLSMAGLANDLDVIVYADGPKTKGRDGRIAWMLLFLGHQNVYLLDGGWSEWVASAGNVQGTVSTPVPRSFDIKVDLERRILLSQIEGLGIVADSVDHSKAINFVSIDTRTEEEHLGVIYDYQPRKGRIPGSLNIPFNNLYTEHGNFLPRHDFLELISRTSRPQFSYCEVGVRAATFSLLYELHTGVRLPVYDGSFMEWSFNSALPVESG